MIPQADPRVQLTLCDIKEIELPGKTEFFMRMEGYLTDRRGSTFISEATLILSTKDVSELPKSEPERSLALRKSQRWKTTLSERYKDNILLPALTFPTYHRKISIDEVKTLFKREMGVATYHVNGMDAFLEANI